MIDYLTLRLIDFAAFEGIKLNDPDVNSGLFGFESVDLTIQYSVPFANCVQIHYDRINPKWPYVIFRNTQCYDLVYEWLRYTEHDNIKNWPSNFNFAVFYNNLSSVTFKNA